MKDSDYYVPGSCNDTSAPFNEVPIPERRFDVTVSQTLSKNVTIMTDDYVPEYDEELDDVYCNTENTDWRSVYEANDFKIQELLLELKNYVMDDMKGTIPGTDRGRYLKRLLEACDGWIEDEYEVIEN